MIPSTWHLRLSVESIKINERIVIAIVTPLPFPPLYDHEIRGADYYSLI